MIFKLSPRGGSAARRALWQKERKREKLRFWKKRRDRNIQNVPLPTYLNRLVLFSVGFGFRTFSLLQAGSYDMLSLAANMVI